MSAPKWMRLTGKTVNDNSTTILSGLAVAGVVATVALAVRATPGAMNRISTARGMKAQEVAPLLKSENPDLEEDISAFETFQAVWRDYLPAVAAGTVTIACIVGANHIGTRRHAALISAYSLVDTALREYKDEVFAQLGKAKAQKVDDEIAKHRIDEHPVNDAQVIITAGGDQLCFDTITGRYFHSDIEAIRRAENEIKRRILVDMYASHNEFYELLGLEGVILGDELGWNIENIIELIFTSHLAADGRPCLAVGYARLPRVDYGKF